MELFYRRVTAGLIDYGIIFIYAIGLYILSTVLISLQLPMKIIHPIQGQLIGFSTLTLPVFLYFIFFERFANGASIGKKAMNIKVALNKNCSHAFIKRNILKLLPWEVAHLGVHWLLYYERSPYDVAIWIWAALIIPQIVVIFYFLSILKSKGKQSIYDSWAGVEVSMNKL